MIITLNIRKLEKRQCNTKNCLAIYNLIFEGKTTDDSKEPALKGLRLFESDKIENRKYIRMPQSRMANGGYFNIFTMPEDLFRELENEIIDHYEKNYVDSPSNKSEEEIDIDDIKL